jgi:NTE family protein
MLAGEPRSPNAPEREPHRAALVLSGGGARGAYEAGVLSYLFENVYPELPPGFEFDLVSGTSVGAIHAAYVAATTHMPGVSRAERVVETWRRMELKSVLRLSPGDLVGIPLRALGLARLRRSVGRSARRWRLGAGAAGVADAARTPSGEARGALDEAAPDEASAPSEVVGGLVDLAPLERMVAAQIPWKSLVRNMEAGRPGALCVSCTEVRSGRITLFMEGALADAKPWSHDPNAQGIHTRIGADHVRASAAIPFLFPAVRIGERYYVDGGLRMNTPLSPALRLRGDRVLVIALKHDPGTTAGLPAYPEDVLTQPAFLLGKVLNALTLDQLEYELHRVELVNSWIERGTEVYGDEFLGHINTAVRNKRGVGYRRVALATIRPSEDVGALAWSCYESAGSRQLGIVPALLTRAALRGVPRHEADLLSYLFFDRSFTSKLVELGREDARAQHDEVLALLLGGRDAPTPG